MSGFLRSGKQDLRDFNLIRSGRMVTAGEVTAPTLSVRGAAGGGQALPSDVTRFYLLKVTLPQSGQWPPAAPLTAL